MNNFIALGVISAFVALMTATMFTFSRVHYILKTLASVIILVAVIYNWELFASVLGFPVDERPPNNAVIAHTFTKPEMKSIYIVVDGPIPRTYTIPYSENFAKKIKEKEKEAEPYKGVLIYKTSTKGKGKSTDAKGKRKEGKQSKESQKEGSQPEENKTENNKNSKDGKGSFFDQQLEKQKKELEKLWKKIKEKINISEEDDSSDDITGRMIQNGSPQATTDFENPDATSDDIEIISPLPRK